MDEILDNKDIGLELNELELETGMFEVVLEKFCVFLPPLPPPQADNSSAKHTNLMLISRQVRLK